MNDVMAAAIVSAVGELRNLPKTATAKIETRSGGSFSYSYAPLPDILDVIKPVLAKRGLALLQHVGGSRGEVGVDTVLLHESGETYGASYVRLPATDPKEAGGVVTYLRRYAICALLGIAGDDDLDASVASPRTKDPDGPAELGRGERGPSGRSGEGAGPHSPSSEHQPSASLGEVDAGAKPGEGQPKPSPGSPKVEKVYSVDPATCTHKFPSGRWLKWDENDRCPKCGTPKVVAIEGTNADLGPA